MSKRKKSRFTKTDVNTICELQRKIDAYEDYILSLYGMVHSRDKNKTFFCLRKETGLDKWMCEVWLNCHDLIDVFNKREDAKCEVLKELEDNINSAPYGMGIEEVKEWIKLRVGREKMVNLDV